MTSILGLHRSPVLHRVVGGVLAALLTGAPALAQSQLWIQQPGSAQDEGIAAAAADGANGAFVGGTVVDPTGGGPFGEFDVWVGRFDAHGNRLWTSVLDSGAVDQLGGAANDGSTGLLACGITMGSLGAAHAGAGDAWLARYDAAGNTEWIVQLGTAQDERADAVLSDGAGGAWLAGPTSGALGGAFAGYYDAWIARLDGGGAQTWIRQLGTGDFDSIDALAVDGQGGVFACGSTTGALGGPSQGDLDAWIARYDDLGQVLWLRQFGTAEFDQVHGAAADGVGGVYVVGHTEGSLGGPNAGDDDAWIARLDGAGVVHWTRQLGVAAQDRAYACSPDGSGGVFVAGRTAGALGGSHQGGVDAWLARFDSAGHTLWIEQFGSAADDGAYAAATATAGDLFVGGSTNGSLGGPAAGKYDPWLARYDGSCNPGTTYCVASSTSIAGCAASISATGSPMLSDPTAWTVSSGPVPGANLGLLLFGSSGPDNTPYGALGGQLCVAAPTFRTAPISSGGDPGQCNGTCAFTLSDLIAAAPIVASGATLHAQVWARDPANADGFLLSDGIELTVCP
jgi:hypothetical protein